MTNVLHITTRSEWDIALRNGVYEAPSLANEGFIHCSTPGQTMATANAFFHGVHDLVLLVIDTSAIRPPLKYEAPAGSERRDAEGLFPHIYGPLNLNAVVSVLDFPADADGGFSLPKGVD